MDALTDFLHPTSQADDPLFPSSSGATSTEFPFLGRDVNPAVAFVTRKRVDP